MPIRRDKQGRFTSGGAAAGTTRGRQVSRSRREAPGAVGAAIGAARMSGGAVRGVGGVTAAPSGRLSSGGRTVGRATANKIAERAQIKGRRKRAAELKSGAVKSNRVERKAHERYAGLR